MSRIEPTVVLSPEQIDAYHREGYLVIDAITTADEVAWLRDIYDRLFEARVGRDSGDEFDLAGPDEEDAPATLPQILGPSKYAPELKGGLYRANALAIARQLLGPEAVFQGEHAILKPARVGAATPWHQDEAYWQPQFSYNAFSLWIPLQGATVENGCMQFVPRSHTWEVKPHHCIGNDPRIHGLEIDEADITSAVACPVGAGGATVHHNRTLHYAGPNTTPEPRRAYILMLGLPSKPRSEPRDFYWNTAKQTPREQRALDAKRRAAESATA